MDWKALAAEADRLPRPRQQGAGSGSSTTTSSWATRRSGRRRRRRGGAHRRRKAGTRALAMTSDCTPRYVPGRSRDGRHAGGGRGVAQPHRRRRAAAGHHRQHELRQPAEAGDHGPVRRLPSRAWPRPARALDFPVVSGNVSLYNETEGRPILPTPAIGGVGVHRRRRQGRRLAADAGRPRRSCWSARPRAGSASRSTCARSAAARKAPRRRSISPPSAATATSCAAQIGGGRVAACHDLSDGGLLVALAEMALAGGTGWQLDAARPGAVPAHAWLFGEDQGRYLRRARRSADAVLEAAAAAGVPAVAARAIRAAASLDGQGRGLAARRRASGAAHEAWLPTYMNATE